ncbi:MAG: hypothetical protein E7812_12070 [Phenylobacterium sp.]|nr:MAG: hypothetical protein E7812_12070 [Phenylobacterium sp.]
MRSLKGAARLKTLAGATACVLLAVALATGAHAAPRAGDDGPAALAAFNKAFTEATRAMDNDAMLSLWEEDGVVLLPETPPLVGKAKIAAMLRQIPAEHPTLRMELFANRCFDEQVSGSWASEWCLEHQVLTEPGKPRFDSWGKMLLVLHRGPSGAWRLSREMWNQALPPAA